VIRFLSFFPSPPYSNLSQGGCLSYIDTEGNDYTRELPKSGSQFGLCSIDDLTKYIKFL